MQKPVSNSRQAIVRSVGGLIRSLALLFLVGLIPYTLYAGYQLYRALSPPAGLPAGPLVYHAVRLIACVLLLYAMWRLRLAGSKLREPNRPER